MLEIARAFALGPHTDRTIVFMATTAEEKGLLGSEYYGLHPRFPLAKTVADLNLDEISVFGPSKNISVQGIPKNTLIDMLEAVAKVAMFHPPRIRNRDIFSALTISHSRRSCFEPWIRRRPYQWGGFIRVSGHTGTTSRNSGAGET